MCLLLLRTSCRDDLRGRLDRVHWHQWPSWRPSGQIVRIRTRSIVFPFDSHYSLFDSHFWFRFIHKSWRLVVPAIVCFSILAIISAAYAIVLNSRLDDFCNEFTSKFNNKDLSCQLLLNRFSFNDDTAWSPATNFNLCKLLSWLTVMLWLLAVLVMLARCILGADFNIEEIENYTEAYDTEVDPEVERVDTKVKFNDAVRRYSRERICKPTTTDRVEEK